MDEYKVVGKFLLPSKVTGEMVKMVVVRDERGRAQCPRMSGNGCTADNIRIDGKGIKILLKEKISNY